MEEGIWCLANHHATFVKADERDLRLKSEHLTQTQGGACMKPHQLEQEWWRCLCSYTLFMTVDSHKEQGLVGQLIMTK